MTTVDQLDSVLETVGSLVAAVGSDQWDAPTPCEGWDVRALVGHVVRGNRSYAAALAGRPAPAPDGDPLGADPAAAYRESVAAVVAAFRAPGVLERPVTVALGTVPGAMALDLRVVEGLVHGWDLARSTGRTIAFPDDVVEQALAFSRDALSLIPPERAPFGPSRPVADDAPPLDRVVALLGRAPH